MLFRFLITVILFFTVINQYSILYAQNTETKSSLEEPTISDTTLKVEKVLDGLSFPTGMAFLGPDDILIIEKNNGTVHRIYNGLISKEPLLDINVANQVERGLLGIAIEKNKNAPTLFSYTIPNQYQKMGTISV